MQTYLIYSPARHQVKVGRSRNPSARVAALQTGAGERLQLLGVLDGDHEARLHQAYAAARRSGEWFDLPDWVRDGLKGEFACRIPGSRRKSLAPRSSPAGDLLDMEALAESRWGVPLLTGDQNDLFERVSDHLCGLLIDDDCDAPKPCQACDDAAEEAFAIAAELAEWSHHIFGVAVADGFLGLALDIPRGDAEWNDRHRFWVAVLGALMQADAFCETDFLCAPDRQMPVRIRELGILAA